MPIPSPAIRRVVLDTDTYNEVDDQFALAHLLLAPDLIKLEAIYAAPFFNNRSAGPGDGMEKSYNEIHRVLDLVRPEAQPKVFRGSTQYLPDGQTPVISEAAADLIQRALAMPEGEKLYVVAMAAATNVASALLTEPKIAERIIIVWLGGHALYWPDTDEFNLRQDLHAARVLFDSKAPLVLIPCMPVASHMITTVAELETHLAPYSNLGRYLTDIVRQYGTNSPGWSKQIWDIAATAWVINQAWVQLKPAASPVLNDDLTWATAPDRPSIEVAYQLNRDEILRDFFVRAQKSGDNERQNLNG